MKTAVSSWMNSVIKQDEIDKYLIDGKDFIDDELINRQILENRNADESRIREIMAKSLDLQTLDPTETAALLDVTDPALLSEMYATGLKIKQKVYGTRIVTFAPLYCSNHCVNNCLYCGFRSENKKERRRKLQLEEVKKEAEALEKIGHKRLIMVYGEHPESDSDYIVDTVKTVYDTRVGNGEIRRVNINAAPMEIERLKKLHEVGIGTFQVFQETYSHDRYTKIHPSGIKNNYRWRLYALHRAMDAGVDDVGMGALFGLSDWKFEVMSLLYHTLDLEKRFGIGPHTISFPRIEAASGMSLPDAEKYNVSDSEFKRLVTVLRLSVPYTGMIITAREKSELRRDVLNVGCTQTDASTRIGIGAYHESESGDQQDLENQQFELGDTSTLDELVADLADEGYLTSFCTAGYRCGRTGEAFMDVAKCGKVHAFCMPNAVLTFKEYLLDYAGEKTLAKGKKLLEIEFEKLNENIKPKIKEYLDRIENGERDLRV
jgi:2-iminoacetate synthase